MALTQSVKESIWLQAILRDLGVRRHLEELRTINIDNQEAIALAKNSQFHASTKYIDIQYHFTWEQVERKTIILRYCAPSEITADIFTKALPEPAFVKHNIGLGLLDYSAFTLQVTGTTHRNDLRCTSTLKVRNGRPGSTGEGWYC